jgi:hypothetical protein
MKNSNKNLLYYIYCALGEKSGKNNKEADRIALIRLLMFLSIFITNSFIVFGVTKTHIIPAEPRPIQCIIHQ